MKVKVLSLFIALCIIFSLSSCNQTVIDESIIIEKSEDTIIAEQENQLSFYEELDLILENIGNINHLMSLSVSENGELVREKYYNIAYEDYKNNIFSVTKSVTSILVGIAIDQGYIDSVDQTIDEFIDTDKYELSDNEKKITIENLLTMSAGLVWNSADQSGEYFNLKASKDALQHVLDREMGFAPGTRFNYSDGSAHMMSVIFTNATGLNEYDFAVENLFEPLGIEKVTWQEDKQGNNYGGFDLHLSCRDMAKIGNMVLNKGVYDGKRIVSEEWIEASTTYKIDTANWQSHNNRYGYYWWLGDKNGYELFAALGHGGQFIYIVPELELVITAATVGETSDEQASSNFGNVDDTIVNEILPLYIKRYESK